MMPEKKEKKKYDVNTLSGSVERVIYMNEDNGYTILDMSLDTNEIVTAVGIMPYVGEGESITVYGKWVHNPKYGRQFSVEQYEKIMPADSSSILRYLASGAVKGIGPKTAARIVEKYGEDTFDVIENHCEWLSEISGISSRKALEIGENFRQGAGMRSTMMFFREYFGAALTMRIYKKWGTASVDTVKDNPYLLCEEVDGIGFEKADAIAQDLGFSKSGSERIQSGIVYMMRYRIAKDGHVCLPEEKLVISAAKLLETSSESISDGISELIRQDKLRRVTYDGIRFIYDKCSYDNEKYIASTLLSIDKSCIPVDSRDIDSFIRREERRNGIEYAPLQKKAIKASLQSGVMILTGGPGTGKTTVVKALIGIFESMGLDVALAAPTGRAANRMSETTSRVAKTIHRLLEMGYSEIGETTVFIRNEKYPLDEEVIIVDEASMIDQMLMASLLKAIKTGARLIIIGDSDQLPSVGAGNILRDITDSERFPTIKLNEIFRQAKQSLIITNAHAINEGRKPSLDVKNKDFFFLMRKNDADVAFTVSDLYRNRIPKTYGKDTVGDIQVISPSRKGESGTENLNMILQNALNPPTFGKKEYKYRQTVFREGDRVMQTKNNYGAEWERNDGKQGSGIFNGEIGVINNIDFAEQSMDVLFDDRLVKYDFSTLEELEHAYAITVHKSQGSEYPIVIIPVFNAPEILLTRNMLYTAVTRASKMVILVGSEETVEKMVKNNRQVMRYTGLLRLLENHG